MKKSFLIILFLIIGMFGNQAKAYLFQNSYIKFEMPENWQCQLNDADWVCKSRAQKSAEEATIILTAKEAGPEDNIESYSRHLSQPQSNAARGTGLSTIVSAPKITIIKGQSWVDSIHRDSEIKNYFTRYLATVKDRIAVAVTFTAHKDVYTNYADHFFKTANSLEVIASKTMIGSSGAAILPAGNEKIENVVTELTPGNEIVVKESAPITQEGRTKAIFFVIAVLFAASALYFILRSRK